MRYFLAAIVVIFFIIIVFVLVLQGFTGTGQPVPKSNLTQYAYTDTVMQYTVDGPVTANQTHMGIRVTIGQYASTIQVYEGYQNDVLRSQTFNNNQSSYYVFLRALELLDYTSGIKSPALADPRGYCPTGNRFTYQIINEDTSTNIQNYWSSTCGQGNFTGETGQINSLFVAQIPDYAQFTEGTGLY